VCEISLEDISVLVLLLQTFLCCTTLTTGKECSSWRCHNVSVTFEIPQITKLCVFTSTEISLSWWGNHISEGLHLFSPLVSLKNGLDKEGKSYCCQKLRLIVYLALGVPMRIRQFLVYIGLDLVNPGSWVRQRIT